MRPFLNLSHKEVGRNAVPRLPCCLWSRAPLAQGTFQTPLKVQRQLFSIYISHSARLLDCHDLIFSS